jgi:hypothetical protein
MNGPLIIVPQPIPPGVRVQEGEHTPRPTCDRCQRTSSERNPIMLSQRRAWTPEHHDAGRRDAICYECRLAMKGRY